MTWCQKGKHLEDSDSFLKSSVQNYGQDMGYWVNILTYGSFVCIIVYAGVQLHNIQNCRFVIRKRI